MQAISLNTGGHPFLLASQVKVIILRDNRKRKVSRFMFPVPVDLLPHDIGVVLD